ncbi:Drug/metabolite transporter [Macleaya cordata]|uniref:Probable purine permease n=1 Tax=Macleaya cordata TaxID=56857 RepID=A0A200PZ64_MACCD|nr:Drug/metabolite transporter [Macleaya cordata]
MSSSMDIEAAAASIEGATRNHHHGRGMQSDHNLVELQDHQTTVAIPPKRVIRWKLLLLCCVCTAIGIVGGPMLQRLYYTHGGNRKWLSSWLQTVGFPFLVAPLSYIYIRKTYGKNTSTSWVFLMEPKLFISSAAIGVILGFDNYMYSAGLSYIPVSTSSLLFSTQLAFTALFAFLMVKQKFTFYSLNSVVLMTMGAVVLALNTSSDRPPGVTQGKYFFGFFLTLGGAGLLGFTMPLVELAYGKSSKPITYTVVMQFQFVLSFFATVVCTVGMLINKDFQICHVETGHRPTNSSVLDDDYPD